MTRSIFPIFLPIFLLINTVYSDLATGSECITRLNEQGTCKHFQKCQMLDGGTERENPTFCNNLDKTICCPNSTPENKMRGPKTSLEIAAKKCREFGKASVEFLKIGETEDSEEGQIFNTSKCQFAADGMIIDVAESNEHEFPHQALLVYNSTTITCGGSLISSNFVLTAAHCELHKVIHVKLGMLMRSQNDQKTFIFNIKEYFLHPNFDKKKRTDDLALLKLRSTVNFNELIYPICLPLKQHEDMRAVVSGFEKTNNLLKYDSDHLMKVTLKRLTGEECQEIFGNNIEIDSSKMLCYGDDRESKLTCKGDSGGPLQIKNDENVHCTYTLVGTVSFGPTNCNRIGIPVVFVNVFNYVDWIVGIVWRDDLSFRQF